MDLHPDLLELIGESRDSVIIQYYLMQLCKLFFVEFSQLQLLFIRKESAQGFRDSTLDSDWDVLLYKVFDHCEMIPVVVYIRLNLSELFIKLIELTAEVYFIALLPFNVFDKFLKLSDHLSLIFIVLEALHAQGEESPDFLVVGKELIVEGHCLIAGLFDLLQQLFVLVGVLLEEAFLPGFDPLVEPLQLLVQELSLIFKVAHGLDVVLGEEGRVLDLVAHE